MMASADDENPFEGMKIKEWSALENVEGRAICPKCTKSRKYFCYTCYIPVPGLEDHIPKVKLPLKIDIIKHASEIDGKSTAAHAAVIAPEDVKVYTYPCIPNYSVEENVVLVFPGKNALSIQDYIDKNSSECRVDNSEPCAKRACIVGNLPISRAVFIDSTWNQSRGIYKDQRLREIPCVVMQSRISQFWRHQHGSPRWFLATIEAIHQFLVEFHIVCKLGANNDFIPECHERTLIQTESKTCRGSKTNQNTSAETTEDKNIHSNTSSPIIVRGSSEIKPSGQTPRPDKPPSKFVKNLSLLGAVWSDPEKCHEIELFGVDKWKGKYGGDYDNLLYFFQFMYYKIHSLYEHDKLRSYQRDRL